MLDHYRTNLRKTAKEADARFYNDASLLEGLVTALEKILHGYTHAGEVQIHSRFSGYAEKDILATFSGVTTELLMVGALVARHFKDKQQGWEIFKAHEAWMAGKTAANLAPIATP